MREMGQEEGNVSRERTGRQANEFVVTNSTGKNIIGPYIDREMVRVLLTCR